MDFLGILFGIILLSHGGDLLTKSSVDISLKFSVPKIIIGMTIVSFATSAPELIVSLNATLDGFSNFAIGNVLGSNIANIGLVLGIITIIYPISLKQRFYTSDFPLLLISTCIFYFIIFTGNQISRPEGFVLIFSITAILLYLFIYQKKSISEFSDNFDRSRISISKSFLHIIFSGFLLWLGSETLIKSAISVATQFEISQRVISITMVAIGTSIPELVTSLVAVFNKEKSISLGNLLGSNIFNVFAVLGITSLVTPLSVLDQNIIDFDIYIMLFFAAIILPLIFFPKKLVLGRKEGVIILIFYSIYVYQLFY